MKTDFFFYAIELESLREPLLLISYGFPSLLVLPPLLRSLLPYISEYPWFLPIFPILEAMYLRNPQHCELPE